MRVCVCVYVCMCGGGVVMCGCVGFVMFGFVDNCAVVLVICVLVFTVFCIFVLCFFIVSFMYIYYYLLLK
jgi:hypothetical protein